jgi:sugar lactone lactonase YvrE
MDIAWQAGRAIAVLLIGTVVALAVGTGTTAEAEAVEPARAAGFAAALSGYVHSGTWQSSTTPPLGVIVDPVRISSAVDGSLVVTDRALHRVQRFSHDGEPLAGYGSRGDGPGQILFPMGAAADVERNRVYVADTQNRRLAVFDLSGEFIENRSLGGSIPHAVAVASDGRVVVRTPSETAVWSPDGTLLEPLYLGPFAGAEDLVQGGFTIRRDLVYAATYYGVWRGGFEPMSIVAMRRFGGRGIMARDVALDRTANIFVLHDRSTVLYGVPGTTLEASLGGVVNSIAGGEHRVFFAAKAATSDRRAGIVRVTVSGLRLAEQERWGDPLTILGWLYNPLRVTADAEGDVFLTDEMYRVQRLTADGLALGQLSLPGLREAVPAPDGDLYVARERHGIDIENPEDPEAPAGVSRRFLVERYSFPGGFVSGEKQPAAASLVWSDGWVEPEALTETSRLVAGAASDDGAHLFLLDSGRGRVLRYSADGVRAPDIILPSLNAGYPAYTDLAVATDGSLLVLHTAARRLYRFDPVSGAQSDAWPVPEWAWRLGVLRDGAVAAVTAHGWLWIFNPTTGTAVAAELPKSAYDTGEPPTDIAVGPGGRLYVTDRSGAAVFVFEPGEADHVEPPASALGCSIQLATDADPSEITVGNDVLASIEIDGECAPHPRSGEEPERLLTSGTLSVTLGTSTELIEGSLEPPGIVDGRNIRWELGPLSQPAARFTYRIRATSRGRLQTYDSINLTYRDGWYRLGESTAFPRYFLVRSLPTQVPVASPGALLPYVLQSDSE